MWDDDGYGRRGRRRTWLGAAAVAVGLTVMAVAVTAGDALASDRSWSAVSAAGPRQWSRTGHQSRLRPVRATTTTVSTAATGSVVTTSTTGAASVPTTAAPSTLVAPTTAAAAPSTAAEPAATTATVAPTTVAPTSTTTARPSTTTAAPTTAQPSTTVQPSTTTASGARYGSVVDAIDAAPPVNQKPAPLPRRPETAPITVTGKWTAPWPGSIGGTWLMFWQGDYVTITGTGYFTVRWEVAYFNRAGLLQMPTWTGLEGELFHVGSGGGRRMDDTVPGATDLPHTWMGRPDKGYSSIPAGAQQMWQDEFFYIDGTVTLHLNETGPADYNLGVRASSWDLITTDVNKGPGSSAGYVRCGLVRDTGGDDAPVPQYLTRSTPADPMSVPQRSAVSAR